MAEPQTAIYTGPHLWHEMIEISTGCVIMAVALQLYNEADYLRDNRQFIEFEFNAAPSKPADRLTGNTWLTLCRSRVAKMVIPHCAGRFIGQE